MGWHQTAKIWVASCSLAAVCGVAIGVVFVSVSNYEHRGTPSPGALPAPGEVPPVRATPPARSRAATSLDTSTTSSVHVVQAAGVATPTVRTPKAAVPKAKPAKAAKPVKGAKPVKPAKGKPVKKSSAPKTKAKGPTAKSKK